MFNVSGILALLQVVLLIKSPNANYTNSNKSYFNVVVITKLSR